MKSKFILFTTLSRGAPSRKQNAAILQKSKNKIDCSVRNTFQRTFSHNSRPAADIQARPSTQHSKTRYSNQICLSHMFMAIGICGCFVSATYAKQACNKGSEERKFWMRIHRLLGYTMTAAIMHRIPYRLLTRAPAHLPGSKLEHLAADLGHLTLYSLMLTVPALALAGDFYAGKHISIGGTDLISGSSKPNKARAETAREFHRWLGRSLIAMSFGGHVPAAGYHQYYLQQQATKRITPQWSLFKKIRPNKLEATTTQNNSQLKPTVKH